MFDINMDNTEKILGFCRENGIEVVGRIPFNPKVTEAMVNGETILEYSPRSVVAVEIKKMWEKILILALKVEEKNRRIRNG
jgi:MinD superfamily P-loop ATPase